MKTHFACLLALCLMLLSATALADKAPAIRRLGSEKAASHLSRHIYAYTDGWDGYNPSTCPDEDCKEYGHVHCYGVKVKLWDTPAKGKSLVPYYPFGSDGTIGPKTEFQLIDVVTYKNKFYANVRVYVDGQAVNSGFVNADYIGCDCKSYEDFDVLPEYVHDHPPFSLR